MAWNDDDDSDLEKYGHRVGAQVQQGAQNMGQALDASIDPRLQALHKIAGSAAGPGLPPQQQMPPPPMAGAPMGGPQMGTMDEMAAYRQKMLDMYNAASEENKPFQALKAKIQTPGGS